MAKTNRGIITFLSKPTEWRPTVFRIIQFLQLCTTNPHTKTCSVVEDNFLPKRMGKKRRGYQVWFWNELWEIEKRTVVLCAWEKCQPERNQINRYWKGENTGVGTNIQVEHNYRGCPEGRMVFIWNEMWPQMFLWICTAPYYGSDRR